MAGEGRIKAVRLPGVGTDGLDTDPDDRCLVRQPARTRDRHARRMGPGVVGIEESLLIARARVPPRPVKEPTTLGKGSELALPGFNVRDLEEVVGVLGALSTLVDDYRRGDQVPRRHLRDVDPFAPC